MRLTILLASCLLAAGSLAQAGTPQGVPVAGPSACEALRSVVLSGVAITQSEWIAGDTKAPESQKAPTLMPAHCLIKGVIEPRHGVPAPFTGPAGANQPAENDNYGINFELRLPQSWAKRFYYEGGGGSDGVVKEAVGHIPSIRTPVGYAPALYRGFAVVTSDSGHAEVQNPGFGMDPKARVDYGYASIGHVTEVAKALQKRFYGNMPRWSYFAGCSKGGQEALQAMQRYGDQFEGIISGAPGYHLPLAAIAEAWDSQALAAIAPKTADGKPDLARAFSDSDLDLVAKAVIKQCAGHDGTDDQLITDPEACRFDPASLQCSGDKADNCLSAPQVTALQKIFDGAKGKNGTALYSPWPYDSGIGSPGWRAWKLGNAKMPALNLILGGLSTKYVFLTPPSADFDILTTPVDDIRAAVAATDSTYKTSALDFMVADSTALESFLKHKGKLILYHGVSDPVFSALDTIRYYKRLQEKYQGTTPDFARLFLVPGMNHCGGGQYSLDSFDTLDPLIAWVEQGKAPVRLVATSSSDAQTGSKLRPGISRPLCPYPQTPHYRGTGNSDEAASFECR